MASLLKPENRDPLTAILKHHVVTGRIFANQVIKGVSLETLGGNNLTAEVSRDGVKIGSANVVSTDIDAANGVIHVIDSVLLPPPRCNQRQGRFLER